MPVNEPKTRTTLLPIVLPLLLFLGACSSPSVASHRDRVADLGYTSFPLPTTAFGPGDVVYASRDEEDQLVLYKRGNALGLTAAVASETWPHEARSYALDSEATFGLETEGRSLSARLRANGATAFDWRPGPVKTEILSESEVVEALSSNPDVEREALARNAFVIMQTAGTDVVDYVFRDTSGGEVRLEAEMLQELGLGGTVALSRQSEGVVSLTVREFRRLGYVAVSVRHLVEHSPVEVREQDRIHRLLEAATSSWEARFTDLERKLAPRRIAVERVARGLSAFGAGKRIDITYIASETEAMVLANQINQAAELAGMEVGVVVAGLPARPYDRVNILVPESVASVEDVPALERQFGEVLAQEGIKCRFNTHEGYTSERLTVWVGLKPE